MKTWTIFALSLCVGLAGLSGCARPIEAIETSKSQLNFELSTLPETFEVWNGNAQAGELTIAIRPNRNWIVIDEPSSRQVVSAPPQPLDKKIITVSINRSILGNGTHTGVIRLQSPGIVTKEVPVSVTVTDSNPQTGLKIENVVTNYGPPNLVGFTFGLRDGNDTPIVAEPVQIQVTARENDVAVQDTSSVQLRRAAARQLRAFLVLDYTQSIQNISGAIAGMESAVLDTFLPALNEDAQVGVYEFHVESSAPRKIADFTVDRVFLREAITGIQDDIGGFVGGSRMYEALDMAAREFDAAANPNEERYIILFSDGRDFSSLPTFNQNSVVSLATQRNIRIYTVGVGNDPALSALTNLATRTGGRYFPSQRVQDLRTAFERIVAELESQYILRWGTVRSATFLPSFELSVNGLGATYVAQQSFNPLVNGGNTLRGVLELTPSSSDTQSTVFLRAHYVPRQITRLRLLVDAELPFTVSKVPATSDGLVESWILNVTNGPDGAKWVNIQSTGGALPFATFGALLRFEFQGVLENPALPFEDIAVDNDIYANGQFFVIEGYDD